MISDTFNQVYFQFISDIQQEAFAITETFKPEGISQHEYSVLEYLYFFKGHHTDDIKKELFFSDYKVRKVIKSLLEKRYVEASADEHDKRKKVYHITRKGKGKLDSCFFGVMKNVQDTYEHLDEEVMKNLIECMSYITKNMYRKNSK